MVLRCGVLENLTAEEGSGAFEIARRFYPQRQNTHAPPLVIPLHEK